MLLLQYFWTNDFRSIWSVKPFFLTYNLQQASFEQATKTESFEGRARKLPKNKLQNISQKNLFYIISRIFLQYFVRDCLKKHIFNSNSSQTSRDLCFVQIFKTTFAVKIDIHIQQLSSYKNLNRKSTIFNFSFMCKCANSRTVQILAERYLLRISIRSKRKNILKILNKICRYFFRFSHSFPSNK